VLSLSELRTTLTKPDKTMTTFNHPTFGTCEILSIDGQVTEIKTESGETKSLGTDFMMDKGWITNTTKVTGKSKSTVETTSTGNGYFTIKDGGSEVNVYEKINTGFKSYERIMFVRSSNVDDVKTVKLVRKAFGSGVTVQL
jgi:hypothetical protein